MANDDSDEEGSAELYVVRKVKDMRRNKATRKWEFFVRWRGYPPEDNTWEGPQAFTDPALYKPLLHKLLKLQKVTQAKEGQALQALRTARWDLADAIAAIRKDTAADAPRARKHPETAQKHGGKPVQQLPLPSSSGPAAATSAASAGPKTVATPLANAALAVAADTAAAATGVANDKEKLKWLQMLQRREIERAPVPYAEVDFIRDCQQKKAGGKPVPAYLVRWRGAEAEDDSWVVATRVTKAPRGQEAIAAFEKSKAAAQTAPVAQESKANGQVAHVMKVARVAAGDIPATGKATKKPAAAVTKQSTGASQKRRHDSSNGQRAHPENTPKSAPRPQSAPTAATSGKEHPVALRTGQELSQMSAQQHELLVKFEQWQLTGQAKPPTEKTCKKYLNQLKKFMQTDYGEYDVTKSWNLCNKQKRDGLLRTVKASARNKRDHGQCSASLTKFFLFLDARAQGWTPGAPVATRAGDTSEKTLSAQRRTEGQSKPSGKTPAQIRTAREEASKRAVEVGKKKEELQQLLETNRLREQRHAAKKAQKHAKRKERHDDDDQTQQVSPVGRPDRVAAKSASASAAEMERLRARLSSLPDTGAQPKLGAIPKKRRTAGQNLEWQGKPVECDVCGSAIAACQASRGAMVDGRIFCSHCLPVDCRPARDAWVAARSSGNGEVGPGQHANANERSAAHRLDSRPGSGASDGRNPGGNSRAPPPRSMKSSRLCKFFNTHRGCYRGDSCLFRHEQSVQPEVAPQGPDASSRSSPTMEADSAGFHESNRPLGTAPVHGGAGRGRGRAATLPAWHTNVSHSARYAPGQHPDQIPHGQQRLAAQRYAAGQQDDSASSPTDQLPQAAANTIAFNTHDFGRDERTNRDTAKTTQAWDVVLMQDTLGRMEAMERFPRGALNHVISLKLSDALSKSYEEFKSLFDQLLGLKMEEQLRRELRDETTTCAERWEKQTYEVDEQMMMKLDLKDVSYDSKRICTPARGGCCSRADAPVFDLCSHVLSKVKTDTNAQRELDAKHQRDPVKHKRRWAVFGAWACPFCGKKAHCGCGWLDLEVDPTVATILQRVPTTVDKVQVHCPAGDPNEPTAPLSSLDGGSIPILVKNVKKNVVWRVPGAASAVGGFAAPGPAVAGAARAENSAVGGVAAAPGSDTDDDEEIDLT